MEWIRPWEYLPPENKMVMIKVSEGLIMGCYSGGVWLAENGQPIAGEIEFWTPT